MVEECLPTPLDDPRNGAVLIGPPFGTSTRRRQPAGCSINQRPLGLLSSFAHTSDAKRGRMTITITEALARELRVRRQEITLLDLDRILLSSKTTTAQKQAALSIYERIPSTV